jgi:AAHS family benzoate transporter-like MFS transporter
MHEINVSHLVDTARLRPFHFRLIFWCLLAMMADGFDLLNASIAGPAIIKEWGIIPTLRLGDSRGGFPNRW